MSNIDEKLASIPTSPLLAERMTKEQPSCENDLKIAGCSDDTISRQAALDAFNVDMSGISVTISGRGTGKVYGYVKTVTDRIKALPPVQPERKKGQWIDKSNGIEGAWNYCSVCGEQAIDLYDFCPNCGADMRGGEE